VLFVWRTTTAWAFSGITFYSFARCWDYFFFAAVGNTGALLLGLFFVLPPLSHKYWTVRRSKNATSGHSTLTSRFCHPFLISGKWYRRTGSAYAQKCWHWEQWIKLGTHSFTRVAYVRNIWVCPTFLGFFPFPLPLPHHLFFFFSPSTTDFRARNSCRYVLYLLG
jgi:hypothetical protein